MGKGLIQGLVVGIAALIITIMIALVIVQNVAMVDDDLAADVGSEVVNETGFYLNGTTYTVDKATKEGFAGFSVYKAINSTSGITILSGNYTVGSTGTIVNASNWEGNVSASTETEVYVSYYYTWTPTVQTADKMITNFTEGIDNVADKIPTILLIVAVVLILGILTLLWHQYKKMNIGSGAEL